MIRRAAALFTSAAVAVGLFASTGCVSSASYRSRGVELDQLKGDNAKLRAQLVGAAKERDEARDQCTDSANKLESAEKRLRDTEAQLAVVRNDRETLAAQASSTPPSKKHKR